MKIGVTIGKPTDEQLRYARQLGADGVTGSPPTGLADAASAIAGLEELAALKRTVESFGLELLALRLNPKQTTGVLYGLPQRDREIDTICAAIRAVGEVGIPTLFFNLTPWRSLPTAWAETPGTPGAGREDIEVGSGPGRYRRAVGRGEAVLLTHNSARAAADAARAPREAVTPFRQISATEMWDRIGHLYERVIPVAEEAGVNVGVHPDDPPENHYRGVEQVLNSVAGLKRLTELVPSPRNGLLFCVGTVHEMGEDTMAAIEHFLERGKIFGAHFRNPRGTVPQGSYQEDFLDEGDLDMLAVMRLFHKHDCQAGLDPDHAVGIVGDEAGRIGFAWELGYMRALKAMVEAGG